MLPQNLAACPDCDMLQRIPALHPGAAARCPRCGHTIAVSKLGSLERTLSLTLTTLRDFINSCWDFGGKAQASAMLQQQGGTFAGAISVAPGVWFYQLTETGLSAELTVTGTKYYKDSDLY